MHIHDRSHITCRDVLLRQISGKHHLLELLNCWHRPLPFCAL